MKKFLALFPLLALLTGCMTPSPRPAQVIDLQARDVYDITIHGFIQTNCKPPGIDVLVDDPYVCPTKDMIRWMDKFVQKRQHLKYAEESWDCDDIAKEWVHLTHLWWLEETSGKIPAALATFLVYTQIETGAFDGRWEGNGAHAMGLLCDADGVWWFVEPRRHWRVKAVEAYVEGTITTDLIVW